MISCEDYFNHPRFDNCLGSYPFLYPWRDAFQSHPELLQISHITACKHPNLIRSATTANLGYSTFCPIFYFALLATNFRVSMMRVTFHFSLHSISLLDLVITVCYSTRYTLHDKVQQRVSVACCEAVGVLCLLCLPPGLPTLFVHGQLKRPKLLSFLLLFPLIFHSLGSPDTSESH